MKFPFARRATLDAVRAELARAEQTTADQAGELATAQTQIKALTDQLAEERLAKEAARRSSEVISDRDRRFEQKASALQEQQQPQQTQPEDEQAAQERMSDREYGLLVLNKVLPMFVERIKQNGGTLPDSEYKALSIYVNGAGRHGVSGEEVEELRARHRLPEPVFQLAKTIPAIL